MPRAERLSPRLDSLLDAVFQPTGDPASLYWEIAGHLGADHLSQAQKKIRKTLRPKDGISSESAVLVACILHLTGFPPHRILHFLSVYVPGGIRFALFELAVNAIFLGEPPIPASLLYDLTQYTYLEKRLLARRSMEISDRLRGSLTPGVLLYLYLLSMRDDLSNENLQLIVLIMKNCFPDLEVRSRIGGASLEEYGEIARAWKNAEQRSPGLEFGKGTDGRGGRAFDRDSASFFLDKYFSDESLAEIRTAAPLPVARRPVRRSGRAPAGSAHKIGAPAVPASVALPASPSGSQELTVSPVAASARPRPRARGHAGAAKRHPPGPAKPAEKAARPAAVPLLRVLPTLAAAAVVAILLVSVPAGFRGTARPPQVAAAHPAGVPADTAARSTGTAADVAQDPAGPAAASARPAAAATETTTYIVQPGDSLWKIFTSVRARNADHRGWMDFLSNTQSLNSLNDPDRLQPGKVLTISVDH